MTKPSSDIPAIPLTDESAQPTNVLDQAHSPYLLQHKDNPVAWQVWGETAFLRARNEKKLIFLSIGYAACHWCHVMEHESFEDPKIADFLNQHFVSIKVDREERPDVDSLYMDALLAMQGQGGWPMSMFLTPALEPIFGGTYFPPHPRWGQPGFMTVLESLQHEWTKAPERVMERGQHAVSILKRRAAAGPPLPQLPRPNEARELTFTQLSDIYDSRSGGFGQGTKFPQPPMLDFLLDEVLRGSGALSKTSKMRAQEAQTMFENTVVAMDEGGIHDHLGGGFHRYAVDPEWEVPHYEKMLYDNAQLVRLFARAHQILKGGPFARLTHDVASYLLNHLYDPEACALMSSEDADTEGVEGKTYVWTPESVKEALQEAGLEPGTFLSAHRLHHEGTLIRKGAFCEELEDHRKALLAVREMRPQPGIDSKIVTAWNGMAISGLSLAGRVLSEPSYIEAAKAIADTMLSQWEERGALPRHSGDPSPEGVLADHAQLLEGLLDLYEADLQPRWLLAANRLCERLQQRFNDNEGGGLFEAPPSASALLFRRTNWGSGAQPDAAAVAGCSFLRLAAYGAPSVDLERIERLLKAAGKTLSKAPGSSPTLCRLLEDFIEPSIELIVAGPADDPRTKALLAVGQETVRPGFVLGRAPMASEPGATELSSWPAFASRSPADDGSPQAFFCTDRVCQQPVKQAEELKRLMGHKAA